MRRPLWLALVLLAGLSTACHGGGGEADDEPAPRAPAVVRVVTAFRKDMPETLRIEGRIAGLPGRDVWVGAPFAGILANLDVAEGDAVKEGEVVGSMQRAVLSAQVASAESAVQRARDAADAAQRVFDREKSLLAGGGTSQQSYDAARSTLDRAHAELSQSENEALAASATAGLAILRAPINGIVGTRQHSPGEMLDAGAPIVRIADLTSLELDGHCDAGEVPELKSGMPVVVTLSLPDLAMPIAATFLAASSVADPGGATVAIRSLIPSPPAGLRPGMPARGSVVLEVDKGAVVVPTTALVASPRDVAIYVVERDAKSSSGLVARRRVVTTDIQDGDLVEITKGVAVGDEVAIGGMYGLEDGAAVTTVSDGPGGDGR